MKRLSLYPGDIVENVCIFTVFKISAFPSKYHLIYNSLTTHDGLQNFKFSFKLFLQILDS